MPNSALSKPVVRFAPSPNGLLHLGHARSALLNQQFAARTGGTMLMRMEDIDLERSRPEFEKAIISDLTWLEISWPEPVRRQSERFPAYRKALNSLQDKGLIYPAFMSRTDIRTAIQQAESGGTPWPRDPDGAPHYPGNERQLNADERAALIASGKPFAWRLDMERARAAAGISRTKPLTWLEAGETIDPPEAVIANPADWGDVILARRDTPASYHLSVVLDDHDQGVTDVIRGQDLYEATAIHRLLQELLGLNAPTYRHHRLVTDQLGRKLAKSNRDISLAALRESGVSVSKIRAMAGIDAPLVPFTDTLVGKVQRTGV